MTIKERVYSRLQDRKDNSSKRFSTAINSIKDFVNSSLETCRDFFSVASVNGARDVLMSASAISFANINESLAKLTPSESVEIYQIMGVIQAGDPLPAVSSPKITLLANFILLGYQFSELPESQNDINSGFDLQVQPDGSIIVEEVEE